jgi:4-hydroxythreonine-4-phosphate dehydrogenase
MGDPNGIGPEIVIKALTKCNPFPDWQPVVFGDVQVLSDVTRSLGLHLSWSVLPDLQASLPEGLCVVDLGTETARDWCLGEVNAWGGASAYRFVEAAVQACQQGKIDAITTAPLSKTALHMAGYHFPGHTELLSALTNGAPPIMMLVVDELRAIHVSTHVSLRQAIELLTPERVTEVALVADQALRRMGIRSPRLALPGLNPHAGENGMFGDEEQRILVPALQQMQERGLQVTGPIPPDTVFLRHRNGEFDAVLALYHDQSHIPLKLLGFERGVNTTLNLPLIRTSVDHGTAFDRAPAFTADPGSLLAAIDLALRFVRQ